MSDVERLRVWSSVSENVSWCFSILGIAAAVAVIGVAMTDCNRAWVLESEKQEAPRILACQAACSGGKVHAAKGCECK